MARVSLTAILRSRGFDLSHHIPFERGAHVGCSQCEALCINGVPCHEHGCPNAKRECRGCNTLVLPASPEVLLVTLHEYASSQGV